MNYEIVSSEIDDGVSILMLASCDSDTFLENLASAPRTKDKAALITRAMRRIVDKGISWAFESKTFKPLNAGLSLCELRIKGKVIRVMTYIHEDAIPVYLFDFDAHQGKGNSIPPHIMEKGERLAKAARECMKREGLS